MPSTSLFIFTTCLTLLSPVYSWTRSTKVDLAFPPISKQVYRPDLGAYDEPGFPYFDCSRIPIDPSIKRTPFPTTGGWLQMDFVNATGHLAGYEYNAQSLIGQISGDDSANQTRWASLETTVFKNSKTSSYCFGKAEIPINATDLVSTALAETPSGYGDVPGEVSSSRPELDIVGTNATIEVRTTLFNAGGSENVEEMIQCAYVTFVTPKDFEAANIGGFCNGEKTHETATVSPIPSATATVQTLTVHGSTIIRTSIATATIVPPSGSSSPHDAGINVGVPVGVSMGAALMILGFGAAIIARRRKHGKTVQLDFFLGFVGSKKSENDVEKGEEKMGKQAAVSGDVESVQSEPLPTYQEATKVEKTLEDEKNVAPEGK